ncbi:MAG: hypothetical protein ABW250_18030 [Pyrinomonadaceae bacterium]
MQVEQVETGEVPELRPDFIDSPGALRILLTRGEPSGRPRVKKMKQLSNAYRYYYYYGSLSARRDGAAMGCPGVTTM